MTENRVGRPPLFDDPEKMQERIDEYFEADGRERPTVSGLCYFLGFEDRHAIAEYAKKPEFSATIKRAKARIENALEDALYNGAVAGVIFNLKNNFGWKDKSEVELGVPDEVKKALWGGK